MKRHLTLSIYFAVLAAALRAQEPLITTVAGTDFVFPASVPRLDAPFVNLSDLATAPDGSLYLLDRDLNLVLRLSTDGNIRIVAGNGIYAFSGDGGPAVNASLGRGNSIAFDRGGNLYIAADGRVRKVDASGTIRTVAGNGGYYFTGDDVQAVNTAFDPQQIALDGSGNLYIADDVNNRIRIVDAAGIIHTFAGNGNSGSSPDGGKAAQSAINSPYLIAVDSKGNVYFKQRDHPTIRRVRKDNGLIETFAGQEVYGADPSSGADARKVNADAYRMAVDPDDNLIVATSHQLLRINQNYAVTVLSMYNGDATANPPETAPAPAGSALLVNFDFDTLALDHAGNVIVSSYDKRVRTINPGASSFQWLAGSGRGHFSGDGGPAVLANLYRPASVAVDTQGNLYVADTGNLRIRAIDTSGNIRTVAGNGSVLGSQIPEGMPAREAGIFPASVRTDSLGRPIFRNYSEQIMRLQNGILSNLLDPKLVYAPAGMAINAADDVFVSGNVDAAGPYANQLARLDSKGVPVVIAGTGKAGLSGDGGPALSSPLNLPRAATVDAASNVIFIDFGNSRIRQISAAGVVTTIAGGGTVRPDEAVPAKQASLADLDAQTPVAADSFGNVYFTWRGIVFRVGTDGLLHIVVNVTNGDFGGDGGPARLATVSNPADLATDKTGNLYIVDPGNNRIRKVLKNAPNISVNRTGLTFSGAFTGAPATPQSMEVIADIAGVDFTTASDNPWLTVTPAEGASPRILEVQADPSQVAGPGEYDGRVILRSMNAAQHQIVVPIHFSVGPAQPPHLSVDKDLLSFTYSVNGSSRSQLLTIANSGGGSLTIATRVTTQSGGPWLNLDIGAASQSPVSLQAGKPLQTLVTANPSGLGAGTYRGEIAVTGSDGSSATTSVVMTVTSNSKTMLLSQTGLSFLGVQGGGVIPPQDFSVLSLGTSALAFTLTPTTLAGNSSWLHAVATTYTANSGADPAAIHVSVDQSELAAGSYYGQILVVAAGAANSPQTVTIFLRVLPADAPPPPPVVQPAELTFFPTSEDAPSSQTLTIYNLSVSPLSFRITRPFSILALPYNATIDPRQPFPVTVQAAYGYGLDPGVVSLAFSDGTVSEVPFKNVTAGMARAANARALRPLALQPREDSGCSPHALNLTVRYIGQTGFLQAGWPAGMGIEVRDDCNNPLTSGAVTAKFSNGDSAVSLTHVGSGVWQGTWASSQGSSHVQIDFHAEDAARLVSADRQYQTDLSAGDTPPSVQTRDVVSYSSPVANAPLAPGSLITLTGQNLTLGDTYAPQSPPLAVLFNGLVVSLKGEFLPLLYASPTRVDAIIPYDIDVNAPQQLRIQLNKTQSTPIYLNLAPAAPVLLSGPDAHVQATNVRENGQTPNTPANPAQPGDTVVFYCIGLGAVSPAVELASATPASPLSRTTNPVTLQIGGQTVPSLDPESLATLTPGFVGLYQVSAVIPAGIQTGDAVPVTLTVAGQLSPTAYLSIRGAN